MSNRNVAGFTLVEMIIAIVIIGVGLAGVLMAFSTTVKTSADPMIHKQMLSIAEEMMEEILLKPYAAGTGTIPAAPSCDRSLADDISDYSGYTDRPICEIDGTAVGTLAGYTVSVALADANIGSPVTAAKKITVTVKRGSESISLNGWRTDYGS